LDTQPVVLKVLLQHRHLQTHRAFCREYDRVAAKSDPTLRGGWPSKAQFYRWLCGELVGLPYPDHCRILESMFPDWKVDQLVQIHDGGIDFVPEPHKEQAATPTTQPILPTGPADQSSATMSAVLDSIERGLEAPANGQAGWSEVRARTRAVGLPGVTFPLAVGTSGPETEEAACSAHRSIARGIS
jgi:hypothetical protein